MGVASQIAGIDHDQYREVLGLYLNRDTRRVTRPPQEGASDTALRLCDIYLLVT